VASARYRAIALALTRCTLLAAGGLCLLLAAAVPLIADGALPRQPALWIALVAGAGAIGWSAHALATTFPATRGLNVFAIGLLAVLLLASPSVERGQDLRPTAARAASLASGRTILVTKGDETMRAALVYGAGTRALAVDNFQAAADNNAKVAALIEVAGDRLTPAMRQRLTRIAPRLGKSTAGTTAGLADQLRLQGWRLLSDLPNPGGRHYVLLAPGPR
jgi:membrane protein implicated in regulation of membrane protease activity